MSKKLLTSLIVMSALVLPGITTWADNINATGNNNDVMKHPVNAYTNHEVKEDMKDSQINTQKAAESKAAYLQAKENYEKSRKTNGAKSPITIDAKKRMHEAHKDMKMYNKKVADANRELRKDEIKAHQ